MSTSQGTKLTQPLRSSCSRKIKHLQANSPSRQLKVNVTKLSLNSLRVDRLKTGKKSTSRDEKHLSSNKDSDKLSSVTDRDDVIQSMKSKTKGEMVSEGKDFEHSITEQQQSDIYKERSLDSEMEQSTHINEVSDETPPLSPQNLSDVNNNKSKSERLLSDVATISSENDKQPDYVSSQIPLTPPVPLKKNDCLKTVDAPEGTSHLTALEDGSRHSLQALDLKETAALTSSSNIERSTLSSSSEIQSLSQNGAPAEIAKDLPIAPIPLVGLEYDLDSTLSENLSKERERVMAKSRSSSLSLRRRNRKRTSAELASSILVTEEDSDKTLTRSPSAKKSRVSGDMRNEKLLAQVTKEIVRQPVPVSNDNMSSNHEDNEGDCFLKSSRVEDDDVDNRPPSFPSTKYRQTEDSPSTLTADQLTGNLDCTSEGLKTEDLETRKRLNSPSDQPFPKRLKSKGSRKSEPHTKFEDPKPVLVVNTSQNTAPQNEENVDQPIIETPQRKEVKVPEIEPIVKKVSPQHPKIKTLPPLPTMYCPEGVSPSEHTPLIIQRFNSYFYQLREAQSHVLTRLEWGEPVKVSSSRQTHLSLDIGRRSRHSRNAEKGLRVNYIDLPRRKLNSASCRKQGTIVTRVKVSGQLEEGTLSPSNETSLSKDGHCVILDDQSREVPLQRPSSIGQRSDELPRGREMTKKARTVLDVSDYDTCTDEDGTDLERDGIDKAKTKKSCVDIETENSKISKQADHMGNQSSCSKGTDSTSTVNPLLRMVDNDMDQIDDFVMLNTQGDIVGQPEDQMDHEATPFSDGVSDEDNKLSKTSPFDDFDKDSRVDNSLSWLSSRKPCVENTQPLSRKKKQKGFPGDNSTPKTTKSKKKGKSGSSAAARMILLHDKDSNSDVSDESDAIIPQKSSVRVERKVSFSPDPSDKTNPDNVTSSQGSELNTSKSKRNKSELLKSSTSNEEEDKDEGVAMEIDDRDINNKKTLGSGSQSER